MIKERTAHPAFARYRGYYALQNIVTRLRKDCPKISIAFLRAIMKDAPPENVPWTAKRNGKLITRYPITVFPYIREQYVKAQEKEIEEKKKRAARGNQKSWSTRRRKAEIRKKEQQATDMRMEDLAQQLRRDKVIQ